MEVPTVLSCLIRLPLVCVPVSGTVLCFCKGQVHHPMREALGYSFLLWDEIDLMRDTLVHGLSLHDCRHGNFECVLYLAHHAVLRKSLENCPLRSTVKISSRIMSTRRWISSAPLPMVAVLRRC